MKYFAYNFADDEEKYDSSTVDTSGLERTGKREELKRKARQGQATKAVTTS